MSTPGLVFAFVLSTLLGAVTHLIVGGDARRLALLLVAAWVGFAAGQLFGVVFQVNALNAGTLHLLPALIGSIGALAIVVLLTMRRRRRTAS